LILSTLRKGETPYFVGATAGRIGIVGLADLVVDKIEGSEGDEDVGTDGILAVTEFAVCGGFAEVDNVGAAGLVAAWIGIDGVFC